MIRKLSILSRVVPAVAGLLLLSGTGAVAQGPQPYPDSLKGEEAKELVRDFFAIGFDPGGIRAIDIRRFAVDDMADYLTKNLGSPFWAAPQRWEVDGVFKIYDTDSAAIVTSRTHPDSIPYAGLLTVDWIWFLRQIEGGAWRISAVRRTTGMAKAMNMMRFIDTTSIFPEKVKPQIAREEGRYC